MQHFCYHGDTICSTKLYGTCRCNNKIATLFFVVEKLLPFKSLFFACKRKLSKTSRHVFFIRLLLATAPIVSQPIAVGDHCREHGHVISKNNVEVLAREEGWFKRKVREAIKIKTLQPTINEILPVSVTRDRSRQTSGHPAKTIGAVANNSLMKKT